MSEQVAREWVDGLHQGFLTSRGRFVDRQEGMRVARAAGQTTSTRDTLYSEDLY